jgi:hypothetical protein
MAIKNKRSNQYRNKYQGNPSGHTSYNQNSGTYNQNSGNTGQANKGQGKKKNKSSTGYDTIRCWFCNKKGYTQIKCRTRLRQNKSLTWKNKEVKSKFHSNKIMLITDFGNMDEARD